MPCNSDVRLYTVKDLRLVVFDRSSVSTLAGSIFDMSISRDFRFGALTNCLVQRVEILSSHHLAALRENFSSN